MHTEKCILLSENYLVLIALVIALGVFAITNADVEIPTQCPEKDTGNTTILLKHESEHSEYYECQQGKKILQVCPYSNEYGDRLHFNPALQTCDWPDLADCKDDNSNQPPVCPKKKDCIRIPHEKDCAKFYTCNYGCKKEVTCPKGLHFNPMTQMCDYPDNAGCRDSCVWTCCPPKDCQVPGVKVRLPHECYCREYYECEDGEQVVRTCEKGKHFDNRLKRCRPADDANCIIRDIPKGKKCKDGEKRPHETDCDKYYECVGGDMIEKKCRKGNYFNPVLGVCDFPENIPCNVSRCCIPEALKVPTSKTDEDHVNVLPSEKDPDCPAEGSAKMPFPTNCTMYYLCENGWKTIYSCPVGLYFNPIIGECDWPYDEIVCDPLPVDLASLRLGVPEGSQDDSKTICYGKCPFPDPKDKTVHLPANDCTMFCKCSNGVPYPMKCPKTLLYDRKEQVCNWSWAVKCEKDLAKDANPAGEN